VGAAQSGETQIVSGVSAGDKVLERVISFRGVGGTTGGGLFGGTGGRFGGGGGFGGGGFGGGAGGAVPVTPGGGG